MWGMLKLLVRMTIENLRTSLSILARPSTPVWASLVPVVKRSPLPVSYYYAFFLSSCALTMALLLLSALGFYWQALAV